MRTICLLMAVAGALLCLSSPAGADWDVGDPHKMHEPQLPDPEGWDVRISNARRLPGEDPQWIVADDWQCIRTGEVSDVHLWVSWRQNVQDQIVNIHLSIHSDIPMGPNGWSIPGQLLWERDFGPGEFAVRDDGTGDQGWFDPPFDDWWRPDHDLYQQINIVDIPDPFVQHAGEVFWLDVSVDLAGESETGKLGWKTSRNHFRDDAVYWDPISLDWVELLDPETGASLDMAFVITPEPASVGLLGLGALGLLKRRRR